jgi:hypothetical protein
MSQLGMVAHWRHSTEAGRKRKLMINAVGALATTIALLIVIVSKFTYGAWITAIVIPLFVLLFRQIRRYNDRLVALTRADGPLDLSNLTPPAVVIPLRRLDQLGHKALRFALTISPDVYVIQVQAEELNTQDLQARWAQRVEEPVRRLGRTPPRLVVLRSPFRLFYERLLEWLQDLTATYPDRSVIVLLPELVHRRWYLFIVSHRATRLKAELLMKGGPHVSVMSTPWYPDLRPARAYSARNTSSGFVRNAGRHEGEMPKA